MKPYLRLAAASVLAGATLASVPAMAQEFRAGFVNTDRVFREADIAKAAQNKLEAEFSKREKDLEGQGQGLQAASDKLQRDLPTLSDSQRDARQKQLAEQDRDFQRRRREFQEDLNTRKNEELQRVLDRANAVVKQLAEAEKYDVIFQDAVYVSPRIDVTDKVIKALNSGSTGAAPSSGGAAK